MGLMHVRFGHKVRARTFGCVVMGSVMLSILSSRLLLYSAGSGVNRVPIILSGFSVRFLCFGQANGWREVIIRSVMAPLRPPEVIG